ncbi:arylesterase [Ginsengibacter hankyongi]|uniref:Arylesterase n=1 Tax=Ginsengibacter hankyongi TaxID=2607284 RepID=A0A5J5IKH1_9BACT|nr:arylesterase [Ginsengibacter hankyongi]KAA9041241.1 arylesterase [Ginsengibacter hankyongi]
MNKIFFINLFLLIIIAGCNNNKSEKANSVKQADTPNVSNVSSAKLKTILFFGNSLTAGYGLDPSEAFPSLIQNKIDSLHLSYKVINAGVSGETTSGGMGRIDWILRQPIDVFVLELGGNDGLRGIPLTVTKKNLQAIIDKVKQKYPSVKIVLAGMEIPPNMGQDYTTEFRKIYPALAKENHVSLIPFLLKGVGGDPKLNQEDGIHPNKDGEKIVAENVWEALKDICR